MEACTFNEILSNPNSLFSIYRKILLHCKVQGTIKLVKHRATCFATLLRNELNSDVTRFTTHVETHLVTNEVSNVFAWVVKRATSLFNSFCSNVAKQVACFFFLLVLPFYGTLREQKISKH